MSSVREISQFYPHSKVKLLAMLPVEKIFLQSVKHVASRLLSSMMQRYANNIQNTRNVNEMSSPELFTLKLVQNGLEELE